MKKSSKIYKLITSQYVSFYKRKVFNDNYLKKHIYLQIKKPKVNVIKITKLHCDKERRKGHRTRVKKEILTNVWKNSILRRQITWISTNVWKNSILRRQFIEKTCKVTRKSAQSKTITHQGGNR